MKQELYMNIETGEILEGSAAIHQYYAVEKHKALDDWLEAWQFVGYSDEDETITANDIIASFVQAVTI